MEIENGPRHSQVVQSKQKLWIHPASKRRQGVHILSSNAGLSMLKEGQQIEYEIVEDHGKTSAVKLTSSDPAASFGRSLRSCSGLAPSMQASNVGVPKQAHLNG